MTTRKPDHGVRCGWSTGCSNSFFERILGVRELLGDGENLVNYDLVR